MTKTFTVSPRSEATFAPFEVKAENYNEAANKASAKLNKGRTHARRITGEINKSGVFHGYVYLTGGDESSVGHPFHLIEE